MDKTKNSAGNRLKNALEEEKPLQIVGTINAFMALIAQREGFRALYLSGSGVATASYGLPDLGFTTLDNVVEEARRITDVVDLPLLVDIDTGFGGTFFSIGAAVKKLEKAGVAAIHLEDQEGQKRCGHRPGKKVVSPEEMCDRISAAVEARADTNFMVMARTDSFATEGLESALDRAVHYVEAGADAIFAEALPALSHYQAFTKILSVPVLANLTEFGKTPLFTLEEMRSIGVAIVLYPLTVFRIINKSAEEAYRTIRVNGTQQLLIDKMQTREETYELLNYYEYEKQLDKLYKKREE